ncbi:MAG: cofactor-independent phosphoglycerate mutase [Planctomycetaceae bacterium]|nr:cofactor-independent phosphoglycerate mutase [Planctomycetaceae bacterium]
MKYALIIPDGCADEPQPSLGGRTPLQAARTPNMDEVAGLGVSGLSDNVPASMPSGSDVGTMSLFGYDPLECHTGRAPLEAAAQGIELGDEDWAVRCNLVTIADGVMQSFTAGQVSNADARALLELMQQACCGSEHWKFHPGVSYRNLLIYRSRNGRAPFAHDTHTVPPHDITDQSVADHLPMGSGACDLRELMQQSQTLFAESTVNQQRQARGEPAATQIWLWGQGKRPALAPFQQRFGVRGAVITAVDLLRGIGQLIGWDVIEVPGATGYLDTDYTAKGEYGVEALNKYDMITVHVEATDEASHEGNAREKVEALERIDSEIVGPLHAALKQHGDYRLLVSPDHPTFLRTKTHSHGFVPFAMCGAGVTADSSETYDEVAAALTGLVLPRGCELMSLFTAAQ